MEDRKEDKTELENEAGVEKSQDMANDTPETEALLPDGELAEVVENINTAKIAEEIKRDSQASASNREDSEVQTVSGTGSSSSLPKLALLFGLILVIGGGLVLWKNAVLGHHGDEELNKITKEEMELLVKDFPPNQLKQFSDNPEQKKKLTDNIKEMLAIASQAQKEGYADKENIKDELKNLEKSLLAQNYDRKINSDKGPMPPFGFITEDRVKEFWGEGKDMSGLSWIWNGAESRRREAEFAAFINPKIELAKKNGQIPKDQEPSESDLKQARDAFAKTYIYYKEAKDKLANLSSLSPEEQKEWKEWKEKTELQIKIQKASFITSNYAKDVLSKKFEVTDEEVEKYMADNPELVNTEEKKKKAEEILQKVKEGGDFAELATEFSEDPGSKNKGGLYEGIGKGQFAPEFEKAAMALEPGEVNDTVVETNFGYHIIKLVKKGERKGANGQEQPTYDVRHILISTMVKDPDNPAAREMPAEQYARTKLQKEKQEKILAEIKENNPVEFPEDFDIPEVSEEDLKKQQEEQMQQMQQMQQQQQGGPKPPPGAPPKPAPKPADKPAEKPAAPNAEKK